MSVLNDLRSKIKIKRIVFSLLFIYLFVGVFLYLFQRSFIYFPVGSIKGHLHVEIFENQGNKTIASVLNRGNNKAIIYFGGNAEDVDFNAEAFAKIFPEYTVYLVKYRGYGGSAGEPTEEVLYSDAIHIYNEIKKNYKKISVIGRSLGSGVATYVASRKEVSKLVLITPFDSIQSIAQSKYPIYPMQIMLKDKYDSVSRVDRITAETLVLAAENDVVVERSNTDKLMKAFPKKVGFYIVSGSGHNDITAYPEFYSKLVDFFK